MNKGLTSFLERLKKNRILASILAVSGGTMFAQVLSTITTPIVTRMFSTSEYGILTTFNSILSILGIVGALKYELSISVADDDEMSISCFRLSVIVLMITTSILTFLLFQDHRKILHYFGADNLAEYWYMIPIGIFLIQYFAIAIQYSYRQRDFKTISFTMVKQSVIGNVVKIVLGFLGIGPIGLLISRVLSDSVGVTSLTKPIIRNPAFRKKNQYSLCETAKKFWQFPVFQFPSTIMSQIALNLPVFFLGVIYDSAVVGAFGLANTVVNLSMDLVGKSVSNVFYAEAAKIAKTSPKELKELSNSILLKMILLGLIPLVALLLLGEVLFTFVFGSEWRIAGIFASIMSVGIFFNFIFTPVSRVFEIYNKQKYTLLLNGLNLILMGVVFGLASKNAISIYVTLALYTAVKSIISVFTFLLSRWFINERIKMQSVL
uniref:lipopolysaccharide biosynthesis protein n=1 Tax=Lachnoclostridium phocaeense TaxID=1871021 RepID=UPI0026DC0D0D|nr:oligosaccharide flippase family protein [Lachnoclostridium phocaeense]